MEGWGEDSVPGDADEANQALGARLEQAFEGTAGGESGIPFRFVMKGVELDQVEMVHMEKFEGAADGVIGTLAGTLLGLGGEEEGGTVAADPVTEELLGAPVGGGGIDMVDAITQEQVQGGVDIGEGGIPEGGGAEDGAGAEVACAAEGEGGQHGGVIIREEREQ